MQLRSHLYDIFSPEIQLLESGSMFMPSHRLMRSNRLVIFFQPFVPNHVCDSEYHLSDLGWNNGICNGISHRLTRPVLGVLRRLRWIDMDLVHRWMMTDRIPVTLSSGALRKSYSGRQTRYWLKTVRSLTIHSRPPITDRLPVKSALLHFLDSGNRVIPEVSPLAIP
jgi:hypothetical protein